MPSWQDCLRAQPEFRSHRHLSPWNSKREQFSKLCPQRDSGTFFSDSPIRPRASSMLMIITYAKYSEAPWSTMPFDQHLFIACIAPRALLVEGFDSPWYDTEGEFLAVKAASPVWSFLGKGGLPDVAWPADYDTSAVGRCLGYVRRTGNHGISAHDWMWMMDFADGVFGLER